MNAIGVQEIVWKFHELVGWHVCNQCAHVVLDDMNFDDDNIDFALARIESNRAEILAQDVPDSADYGEYSERIDDQRIDMVAGFLRYLKTIPEDVREWGDER